MIDEWHNSRKCLRYSALLVRYYWLQLKAAYEILEEKWEYNMSKQKDRMIKQFLNKETSINRDEQFKDVQKLLLFVQPDYQSISTD